MQSSTHSGTRSGLLLTLLVLGIITTLVMVPSQFQSEAGARGGTSLVQRTSVSDDGLAKMWDIREERSEEALDALANFRQKVGKDASAVADIREGFVRGEAALKQQLPTAKIEYNQDIRIPEVITPDVGKMPMDWLTPPSDAKRVDILRGFLKQNSDLVGMNDAQVDGLLVGADYTNPAGNLSFVRLEQRINGVEVFRGEITAGFRTNNQMIRAINNLAPGLEYGSLSADFRNPVDAVRKAASHINHELRPSDTAKNDAKSTDLRVVFGEGDSATLAEKIYFPTEPGVAVPAWRILIWQPVTAYYVIVDAHDGVVLWHKNIGDDQAEPATYSIYANPASYINAADHAAPLSPYVSVPPNDPTVGAQGTLIAARTNVTLVGNEGPLSFNNNGWITDGTNISDGNSNEAGVDRVTPDGVDAPLMGDAACPGMGCRTFTSMWNPPPGNPAPGDEPLTVQAQRGAVTQMFYVMNRYHDVLYLAGFTEPARNFQHDNFGRGGNANDRVRSEGQDSSGSNNANFQTPADGTRGRMQMYLWTGPTPDRDGTADGDIVIHEVSHGLSHRIHGNGSGLGVQGGMMGEGWGDWYAHTMLAEPTDPINGIYGLGGYSLFQLGGTFMSNHYHGIRRFPTAVIAFTGGPMNKPHNPLTFGHINSNCDTTLGTTTTAIASAFPRNPVVATSGNCAQVHNAGEIWKSALWEIRSLMVTRLGFTAGTTRVIQVVTDGMKLSPINPTMLQERDGILTGAAALPVAPEAAADVGDIWEGMRRRGFGFSATVTSATVVTEAFDPPNALIGAAITVSDSTGDNDGFPEPGEAVSVSVPISNNTGSTVNNVVASIVNGGNANYGNIPGGATEVRQISYTVPSDAVCGSLHTITINGMSDIGPLNPRMFTFRLGVPVGGPPVSFSNPTPITIPSSGPSTPYPSVITVSGLTGNKAIKLELTDISHTFPDDVDFLVEGPGGQTLIFLSDAGGTNDWVADDITLTDLAAAAASDAGPIPTGEYKPTNYGASDPFDPPAPAGPHGNPAPAGTDTFESKFGLNGANMNGDWKLYIDDDLAGFAGTVAGGWKLTFESNEYACNVGAASARADFDGDGKTDLSVFRPSEGNWYLNRSTDGFAVLNWGISTDTLVPGDYDGDNKTDTAVFRPSNSAGVPDFYILNSNGFTVTGAEWGVVNDKPVVGDFDGDGESDLAVFRPSNGTWYVLNSGDGSNYVEPFGLATDIPMSMDTNGDGRAQIAVYRPSDNTWYIARPTGTPATNFDAFPFGTTGDFQVPADYDGDNKDDVAVYRPSNGTWYVRRSSDGGTTITPFGGSGDIPVPGDYDGDGEDDLALYRNGTWYVNRSTSGLLIQTFGLGSDRAVPKSYIP